MKCIGHAFFILLVGVCNTVFELQVCNFGHASFTRPKTVSTVPIHPVLGRFNAIGPMVDKYAGWTPYNFAFNDPANKNGPGGDDPNIRYLAPPPPQVVSGGWSPAPMIPQPNAQQWLAQQQAAGIAVGAGYQYLQDSDDWGLGAAQAAANDAIAQGNLQMMVNNALASPGGAGSYQHNGDGSWSKWNPYGGGDITEAQWVALGGDASTINSSAGASFSAGAWQQVSSANQGGGATVYNESDKFGHTYIEVNGTVFSYGRYAGGSAPSSGEADPVGPGILQKLPHQWAVDRMGKNPTTVYQFPNANADQIYNYLNDLYNCGVPNQKGPGMVIGTYILYFNDCTTLTTQALQQGGVNIPTINAPFQFHNYETLPSWLK